MIIFMLFMIALFQVAKPLCFTFEQGTYKEFNILVDPNFICWNGAAFQKTIKFECGFFEIPQIIITTVSYKYDQQATYFFKILSITQDDWTFQLECLSGTAQLYKYEFTWLAVNDDRLLVINDNIYTTSLATGSFSSQYSFLYAKDHISRALQPLSYFSGDFFLQDQVEQGYKYRLMVSTGRSGLGVQIILYNNKDFTEYGDAKTYQIASTQNIYVYDTNIPIHTVYFYTDSYTDVFRELQFSDNILGNGSKVLTVSGYGGGTYYYYITQYDISKISLLPHSFKKMRISKRIDISYEIYLQFTNQQLYFIEFKKTFKDVQTGHIYNVSSQSYSFIYQYLCKPWQKITGSILQIKKCAESSKNFVQYCHKAIYLVTMHIQMYQLHESFRDLYFELTNQGLKIQQTINSSCNNCSANTYTLVDLQITNI